MKIKDITERFKDNSYPRHLFEACVLHWTASGSAKSAIDWLDQRLNGEGTVAYNFVIDRDGTIYMLVDPLKAWVYHSGTGAAFDKKSISVAFVSWGIQDQKKSGTLWVPYKDGYLQELTQEQIEAFAELYGLLTEIFGDVPLTHHAAINKNKFDLTDSMFDEVKRNFEPRITPINTDKRNTE